MIGLMRMTLADPAAAWADLQARTLPLSQRWALVFLTASLSALLSFAAVRLVPSPPGTGPGVLELLSGAPMAMAGVQVASAAMGAFLLAEVGRIFGGKGRFADALLVVGWVEAVMIALQALQLALTLVLPPAAALVGLASLGVAAYLVVALTMALHGFRNALLVILGIVGTLMVTGFLMSVMFATLGLMPEGPA